MIKMMLAARRKPGMTLTDYRDYIRVQHGKLAFDQPNGVLRYVQNHVFDGAYGAANDSTHGPLFARDSVIELWFANPADFGRSMASPYTHEVIIPDGKKFADVATNIVLVTREEEVSVPHAGSGFIKVIHYLQKRPEIALDDFAQRWRTANRAIIDGNTTLARALRRCALSHALPPPPAKAEDTGTSGSFSGTQLPSFHGVASMWFDHEDALTALRGYFYDLNCLGAGEGGFFNPSAGFHVCAHETTIFEVSQT